MPDLDRVGVEQGAGGGACVIAGLVVAGIVFLTLLLVFGETLFSGKAGVDHSRQPLAESASR